MAILQKIIVQDFRNISFAELSFSAGVNCICGDNGQGKTNLLDAIYLLSMTKSAFGLTDQMCVRHGCRDYSIAGTYSLSDGLEARFTVSGGASGKTVRRDGKAYPKVSAHIGVLPVVMVSPQDSVLVSESGEERRRFVNSVLSQLDPAYLAALQRYNRFLAHRNRMLKDGVADPTLLDVLDAGMSECAAAVEKARSEFSACLEDAVSQLYSLLSGGCESVGIRYQSDLKGRPLADVLASCRERDLCMKYTTAGVQRDDFIFTMDGHPIRRCGSQGQQKSFLVALKLSQLRIMQREYGSAPVLLLDDVFDKLDASRMSHLLDVVCRDGYGQIFITDTMRTRIEEAASSIHAGAVYFTARNGEFQAG